MSIGIRVRVHEARYMDEPTLAVLIKLLSQARSAKLGGLNPVAWPLKTRSW